MLKPISVLILEDRPVDAELMLHEVRQAGFKPTWRRVETEVDYLVYLEPGLDLILSDYALPQFDALRALHLLQETGLDIPFIVVSGSISEEVAVNCMKQGAADYLLKDRLVRLGPAVQQALAQKQLRVERKLVAEALRRSEARYRGLFDHSFNGFALHEIVTDEQGQPVDYVFLEVNQAFEELTGLKAEAVVGKRATEVLPGIEQDPFIERYGQVALSGEPERFEQWASPLDKYFDIAVFSPRRGQFATIFSDITERKQTEEEIRRRNRELALLNRIIAASTTELEPEAILETTCRELALAFDLPQAAAALLNPERTEAQVVAEYLAEGRPTGLDERIPVKDNPTFQYLLTRKGPLIVEEAQHDPRLAPIHDLMRKYGVVSLLLLPLIVDGEVVGSLGLDATEPRHFSAEEVNLAWSVADQVSGVLARARLARSHQRLITALEQTADTVIIADPAGTILYVNPAFEQTTGYGRTEAVGQHLRLLQSEQQDPDAYADMWATIRAGQVWRGRLISRKKDGAVFTEEATLTPVMDDDGQITTYVGVNRDVTWELALEEQYRQAQKMEAVGRLTGGIAHDFNNLLTAINGFAEILQMRLPADDPHQKSVHNILQAGRRAAELVHQLMAFSRKQVIEPQSLELNTVVAQMDKLLQRIIGEDIQLDTRLAPELWAVEMDPSQLEQILANLVVNARDAMPDGGQLTLETANVLLDEAYTGGHLGVQPGEYVLLAVSDTGLGMAEETLAHIFEPFFTTKQNGQGTGLGLATVYGIVQQNGGDIWVYSEEEQGTTFKIYLPRSQEKPQPVSPPENKTELRAGRETILLVEDHGEVRDLAQRVLAGQGYTLLEAQDGQEAVQLSSRHPGQIDLLLTDVVMPDMNGKVLADQLSRAHPGLKTLYMSGYTDETIVRHGVLEPEIAFLQKPFNITTLVHKVRAVLDDREPAAGPRLTPAAGPVESE